MEVSSLFGLALFSLSDILFLWKDSSSLMKTPPHREMLSARGMGEL
jgi:hypothetical protein